MRDGITCPACNWANSDVKDSRPTENSIRRRRRCQQCSHRWTTYEANYPFAQFEKKEKAFHVSMGVALHTMRQQLDELTELYSFAKKGDYQSIADNDESEKDEAA